MFVRVIIIAVLVPATFAVFALVATEGVAHADNPAVGGNAAGHRPLALQSENDQAAAGGREDADQQQQHHPSASGVMAKRALGVAGCKVLQVMEHRRRAAHEITEAGMLAADETPDNARCNQRQNGVARPRMHGSGIVASEVGEGEQADQAPVENPDEPVPNLDVACAHGDLRNTENDARYNGFKIIGMHRTCDGYRTFA